MKPCPCGSTQAYLDCCGALIEKDWPAATPEALMRSRYTACTKGRIEYIKKTMHGDPLLHFDEKAALRWARSVKWVRLIVRESTNTGETGTVLFEAHYIENHRPCCLRENSLFRMIAGKWFYVGA